MERRDYSLCFHDHSRWNYNVYSRLDCFLFTSGDQFFVLLFFISLLSHPFLSSPSPLSFPPLPPLPSLPSPPSPLLPFPLLSSLDMTKLEKEERICRRLKHNNIGITYVAYTTYTNNAVYTYYVQHSTIVIHVECVLLLVHV